MLSELLIGPCGLRGHSQAGLLDLGTHSSLYAPHHPPPGAHSSWSSQFAQGGEARLPDGRLKGFSVNGAVGKRRKEEELFALSCLLPVFTQSGHCTRFGHRWGEGRCWAGSPQSGPRLGRSWAFLLPEPEFSQPQHRVAVAGSLWGLCLYRRCFPSLLPRVLEAAAPCIDGAVRF